MKTFKMFLALALVLALAVVGGIGLVSDLQAAGFSTQVGGMSLIIDTSGNFEADDGDVVWDTPEKFTPDFVQCFDGLDDGDTIAIYEWNLGMGDNMARARVMAGDLTYESSGVSGECGFHVVAGTITIEDDCFTDEKDYFCWAVRYSQ